MENMTELYQFIFWGGLFYILSAIALIVILEWWDRR